jgi:hypothetical protein
MNNINECLVKVRRAARWELLLLDTLDLIRHIFLDPILAAFNDFLKKETLYTATSEIID